MSSLDDIVTIVEFHRRRWKPPASLTISLTKSLRVAGSLDSGKKTESIIPVEGKSSVCLICMKYRPRIMILIVRYHSQLLCHQCACL